MMVTYEYADPRSSNVRRRRRNEFQIGEITSREGAESLAAAVIKLAAEEYLTKPKGCTEHDSAEQFFLDEEAYGFYLDLCPAATRDVERMRKRITHDRLHAAIAALKKDRASVNNALAIVKAAYEKDFGDAEGKV